MPFIIDEFCKELEKIFGPYKSRRISRNQCLISGGRTAMSSPYSNFVYEISLWFNIPVSDVTSYFGKIANTCILCVNIFINVLEENLEKIVQRIGTESPEVFFEISLCLKRSYRTFLSRVKLLLRFYSMKQLC